jgi:uncharacterized protein YjeT (DUF2065 family)
MAMILLGIGLVLAFEGLVFALLPGRLEDIVKLIAGLPVETRRMIGLIALGLGVTLIWSAHLLA